MGMVALVRDLLRKDVHHPEQDDEHDWYDEQDEEGEERGELVFGLFRQKRRVRLCWCQQNQGKREEDDTSNRQSDPSTVRIPIG